MSKRSVKRRAPVRRKRQKFVMIGPFQYPIVGGFAEVEGHKLNQSQLALFADKYQERRQIAERDGLPRPSQEAYRLGFSNVLWEYRPRAKAKDRLLDLTMELGSISSAIGNMRKYNFTGSEITGEGASANAGCVLLATLVQEAEKRLARIKHFVESMTLEPTTKLQDWTKREAEFEQLGGAQS